MWNNFFRYLFIKIKQNEKGKGFAFFIPFSTVTEPLEDFVDFLSLVAFIAPWGQIDTHGEKKFTLKQGVEMIRVAEGLVSELGKGEKIDLVDIETKEATVKISIR